MKLEPKLSAPFAVLVLALLSTTALVVVRPKAEPQDIDGRHPVVRVIAAQPSAARPEVRAAGTVAPRVESDLVAEVGGRVVWVSPRFEAGGFFEADEELLRIESRDHEVSVERARASVERAESQLALAHGAHERARSLRARNASSVAKLEEAAGNEGIAAANLREARAQLVQAELDLGRTRVRAPFAGRVRVRSAEVGMFVSRGTALASIFSVDAVEVRLPIPAVDLAFLDLADAAPGDPPNRTGGRPRVELRAPQAGPEAVWSGEIVRTEGVLDERTRMIHVVARIANPYAPAAGPPLTIGLFVEASIEGRELPDVLEVPRGALRAGDIVLVVDEDSRLRRRHVTVKRAEGERVWISDGLQAGERVCATPPAVVVEGMRVRIAEPEGTAGDAAVDAEVGSS